jgi:hypothetical protein
VSVVLTAFAYPVNAECIKASEWSMGDATADTYNGRLVRTDGSYKLYMPHSPVDEEGVPSGSRFQISSSAKLPKGKFAIRDEIDYSGEENVQIMQRIGSQSLGLSLNDEFEGSTVNNPKEGHITFALSGRHISQLVVKVSGLSFCRVD